MKCPLSYTACGVVISRWGVYSGCEAVVLLLQLPLLSEIVCLPECEIAMSLQALRLPHAHPSDDEDTVPASTALGVLLNRHTHEKLSLARAEPPSTERHDPFLLVYPKWFGVADGRLRHAGRAGAGRASCDGQTMLAIKALRNALAQIG